jgi:hypothetical protein
MWFMIPDKNNNMGNDMDLNTLMQFYAFMEQKQKEAKEGSKPKEEDKKKGDYWKTFLILMIITPPVAITYLLALVFGVLQIVKVAKGL